MNNYFSQIQTFKPLHQIWNGNNKFFNSGNIYAGPHYWKAIIIILLISTYFIIFILYEIRKDEIINYIVISLLFFITIIFAFRAAFKDPGVMNTNNYSISIKNIKMCWFDETTDKFQNNNGRLLKIKFCKTCLIFRPIGTSHCAICNCCIERYDHHCPWIGNCIGRNNYRDFIYFLLFFNLFCVITFIKNIIKFLQTKSCENVLYFDENNNSSVISDFGIQNYIQNNCTFSLQINETFNINNYRNKILENNFDKIDLLTIKHVSIVLIILCVLTMFFITTLFIYHIRFITLNLTTYARSKLYLITKIYTSPFDKGFKRNFNFIFCKNKIKRVNFKENIITSNSYQNIANMSYINSSHFHLPDEKENIIRIFNQKSSNLNSNSDSLEKVVETEFKQNNLNLIKINVLRKSNGNNQIDIVKENNTELIDKEKSK